jgi:hypothetical protein
MVNSEVVKYVDENKKLQQELVRLFFWQEIKKILPALFTLFLQNGYVVLLLFMDS